MKNIKQICAQLRKNQQKEYFGKGGKLRGPKASVVNQSKGDQDHGNEIITKG